MLALKWIIREERKQNDGYAYSHRALNNKEPFLFD